MTTQDDSNTPKTIDDWQNLISTLEGEPSLPDEKRASLSEAYRKLGNEHYRVRTPESLKAATASSEKAIEHLLKLPLEVDQYRNDLASAYMNLGNALSDMRTPKALREAVSNYVEAIRLLEDMDHRIWQVIDVSARALVYKAIACLEINTMEHLDMATDAADDGLNLLSELETAGIYVLRPLRESLFPIA
jgi:hypothetical protein